MTDRTLTFGDLCCAIADGKIAATLNESMYEVNALELRRYFSRFLAAQPLSCSDPQAPSQASNGQDWPASTHSSVA